MAMSDLPARWRGRTVLVLGDALLDGWLTGTPRRLCREAPVPALTVEQTSYTCGGAANTAVNVAALGGRAVLVAATGDDHNAVRLRHGLEAAGVRPRLLPVPGRRTVAKCRLVADGQIVMRFDEGDTAALSAQAERELAASAAKALARGVDAVMVCDYDGGTLGAAVRELLVARRARIPLLVVDAHDLRPWRAVRPDLVTPSLAEAQRLLTASSPAEGARAGWVAENADRLVEASAAGVVAVTLDADGALVVEPAGTAYRTYARPVPASQTAGAGDAYVAAFTLALAAGVPLAQAAEAAQLAATASTRTPGTAVCDAEALIAASGEVDQRVVTSWDELVARVGAHRAQGRRIVFTNGCFDVLHRGHVGYLEQARRLGDVLIVAVNSDESVRRLKGPDRPVNPVEDRVAVVAALSCVEHVVVFEEDSPAPLIALVRPDVYVKGGDYREDMIPEAPLVRELGGEVRTLDYLPDRSTTTLISKIRASSSGSPAGPEPAATTAS